MLGGSPEPRFNYTILKEFSALLEDNHARRLTYDGAAREGRNDLPRVRQRGKGIGRLPVLFMRYIYMRHMHLSRSCSVPEVFAGNEAGTRADSNSRIFDTSNRLA